jgi:lactate dehydrogenase-like 2-hydroxyacid dehydrogenase
MKPLVLVSPDKKNVPPDVLDSIQGLAEVKYVSKPYFKELENAHVVLVGTEQISTEYLDKAPKLKLVARFGVGYDSVNVDECTKRKVMLTNTPDVLSGAVADHTWALILSFNRHIPFADSYTRTKWSNREGYIPFGWDLEGKILGILGLGRIGSEVLKRAKGFPIQVIYNDIVRRKDLEEKFDVKFVNFEELMRRSDILTIHTSLTESTRSIINEDAFNKMKQTALIVNTSRGPVIDETALIKALQDKKIKGAALDVYYNEPILSNNPLLKMDNVVLTPHCASATWETRRKMAERSVGNVKVFLEKRKPPDVVPEQKNVAF